MQPILAVAALFFALASAPLAASDGSQVWVPGHWQNVGHEQVWVSGGYHQRQVTTTTTVTTVTVVSPPPPPPQVWVAERWLWTGSSWQLQPGHWEYAGATTVVAACPPPPPQQVVVHHYEQRQPRVNFGVGVILGGGHYGHHRSQHGGHHSGGGHHFSPPPHFLPRPPRNLPDPLGLFRHDPLGLIRR